MQYPVATASMRFGTVRPIRRQTKGKPSCGTNGKGMLAGKSRMRRPGIPAHLVDRIPLVPELRKRLGRITLTATSESDPTKKSTATCLAVAR